MTFLLDLPLPYVLIAVAAVAVVWMASMWMRAVRLSPGESADVKADIDAVRRFDQTREALDPGRRTGGVR